jgi:hypothetical protein
MKTTLITFLSMTILTLTYGQEISKDEEKIPLPSPTIALSPVNTVTLSSSHITIDNRLDLEADSAQYDAERKILTAFGVKRFTFNGKVVVNEKNGIYTFYLGDDSLPIAIIEE